MAVKPQPPVSLLPDLGQICCCRWGNRVGLVLGNIVMNEVASAWCPDLVCDMAWGVKQVSGTNLNGIFAWKKVRGDGRRSW